MNNKGLILFILILFFVAILPSCNVTKLIPEGKYLVTRNSVHVTYTDSTKKEQMIDKSETTNYIPLSQIPNARFFGIDIRTWLYMKSNPNRDNWWNRTLRNMGQMPIYYDSTLMNKSAKDMHIYMASEGFLDNTVKSNASFKKKRAYIDYSIEARDPYIIDSVWYNINDANLDEYFASNTNLMLIKKGNVFTRNLLDKERLRITEFLNNKGFYTFSVNDIDYLIDTTKNTANVQLNVNKKITKNHLENHKRYKINNIYVYPNDKVSIKSTQAFDTIRHNNIDFIYVDSNINVKINPLYRQIKFAPGSIWSPVSIENTNRSFLNMKYYKSSNIEFSENKTSDSTDFGYLDTYITLIPSRIHGIKAEAEVSSNTDYTSIVARLGYSNKNTFKHSEVFDISFNIGYDVFYNRLETDAYQIGVKSSLSFPRLIVPFRVKSNKFIHDIESLIYIGYDIQNRPDYNRHIVTSSFGYKWSDGKYLRFSYNPVSLNYIDLPRVTSGYLDNITNDYLKNTFDNQIIAGTTFSTIFDTNKSFGSSYSVKFNFETGGNLLYLGGLAFNQKKATVNNEQFFEILGIRYAQYLRADIDFSYKYNFYNKSALVTRVFLGAGLGYGNGSSMPFERAFYSGGNASMRGWVIRTLGPGGQIPNTTAFENSLGNIRLEMNLEGRFPIFGPVRGALFFDAGNIWSNGKGETDSSAIFKYNSFYKQLGFNTGVGIRLDFSFFVLRLDWGVILHNPNKLQGDRWINKSFSLDDTSLHFAIGYPF